MKSINAPPKSNKRFTACLKLAAKGKISMHYSDQLAMSYRAGETTLPLCHMRALLSQGLVKKGTPDPESLARPVHVTELGLGRLSVAPRTAA